MMMHVFGRHVQSSPTKIASGFALYQLATFHESWFSWNYAPQFRSPGYALPSYARSHNRIFFSCWQITLHKPESQRMRAMTARRGSKLRRVVTL